MSSYTIDDLLTLWQQETLTPEQAIGQALQALRALEARLRVSEERLRALELQAQPPLLPPPTRVPTRRR